MHDSQISNILWEVLIKAAHRLAARLRTIFMSCNSVRSVSNYNSQVVLAATYSKFTKTILSAPRYHAPHYSRSWSDIHSASYPRGYNKEVKVSEMISVSIVLNLIFLVVRLNLPRQNIYKLTTAINHQFVGWIMRIEGLENLKLTWTYWWQELWILVHCVVLGIFSHQTLSYIFISLRFVLAFNIATTFVILLYV